MTNLKSDMHTHSGIADCIVLRYPINRCKYVRQEPLKLSGFHVRRHGSKEAQNGQGSQRPGCLILKQESQRKVDLMALTELTGALPRFRRAMWAERA